MNRTGLTGGGLDGNEAERFLAQSLNGLGGCGVGVEHVLHPRRIRECAALLASSGGRILGFGEVKKVCDEALFIHAIGRDAFVGCCHDASIPAFPCERRLGVPAPLKPERV